MHKTRPFSSAMSKDATRVRRAAFRHHASISKILAVNFSSMSNAIYVYDPFCIEDFVDDAVISDTNPPIVLASSKFSAAGRPRISTEPSHSTDDPVVERIRQSAKVPLSAAFKKNFKHALCDRRGILPVNDNGAVSSASFLTKPHLQRLLLARSVLCIA
jgi:hypothetical protein